MPTDANFDNRELSPIAALPPIYELETPKYSDNDPEPPIKDPPIKDPPIKD